MPSEPMQGLSLMGSVVWGRIKRNPAPAAAAGVAVVLLMARRRRRRLALAARRQKSGGVPMRGTPVGAR